MKETERPDDHNQRHLARVQLQFLLIGAAAIAVPAILVVIILVINYGSGR